MPSLDLAVIGNCAFSALIDRLGRIVWSCLPRIDGDPAFCSLLDVNGVSTAFGFFDAVFDDMTVGEQFYMPNTAVLVTILHDAKGPAVEIVDFAPRYKHYGRIYRPDSLVRQITPLVSGKRIKIRLRPAVDYGRQRPETTSGSNHIRYLLSKLTLRLTTDVPVSFVLDEIPFQLDRPVSLYLGPDETLTRPLAETVREQREATVDYWREWVRYLSIPFEWQQEVIRAAITLKLCSFEESGAIVAALTTSIPEAPNTVRNWDYRYCWLRDAYFVVHALNRLGVTRTMEDYLHYISNVVAGSEDGRLQPVYGVAFEKKLTESTIGSLPGYRGMGPVRVGNQAYEHVQNDAYGSVVMAATQMFFDSRLDAPGDRHTFELLEHLGEQAVAAYDQPDAGLWEFRTSMHVHTFSSVMCWAACDRLGRIADRMGFADRTDYWRGIADKMRRTIEQRAWRPKINSFAATFDGDTIDASLLLLEQLGFLAADDPRFAGTVAAVERELKHGELIYRYITPDDFGLPQTAFTICTFWYIDALAALGRTDEARTLFERMLSHRNHVGLLSEDVDVATGELWGNFPQTYSMVGLINSALRLSKSWETSL